MNRAEAPAGLPDILVPFVTLSYPTDAPAHPDAFPTSKFFSIGLLDGCFIVTCIAVMAILRDVARVFLMEPFAKWYLTRLFMHESESKKAATNGHSNGNANGYPVEKKNGAPPSALSKRKDRIIHRSVLRFAEQSWSLIYYTVQFGYGLVCSLHSLVSCAQLTMTSSMSTSTSQPHPSTSYDSGKDTLTSPSLDPSSFIT